MANKVLGYVNIIKRSGKDGSRFPVTNECLIGSGLHCEIRIYLPDVAVEHCLIQCHESGRCYLKNLCPIKPATLNGSEIMGTASLNHGDVIGLSDRVLRWEYEGHTETPSETKPTMSLLSVSSDDIGQSKRPTAVVTPQVRDRNATSQSLRTWVLRRSVGDALSSRNRPLARTPDRRRTSMVNLEMLHAVERPVQLELNENGKRNKEFPVFVVNKPSKKRRTNSVTAMQSSVHSHNIPQVLEDSISSIEAEVLMVEKTEVSDSIISVDSPTKSGSSSQSPAKLCSSKKKKEVDIALEKTPYSPKVFYGNKFEQSFTSPFEVLQPGNASKESVTHLKTETVRGSLYSPENQNRRHKSGRNMLREKSGNVSVSPTSSSSLEMTNLSFLGESATNTPSGSGRSRKSKSMRPQSSASLEVVVVSSDEESHLSKRKSGSLNRTADLSQSYLCKSEDFLEIESSGPGDFSLENQSVEEQTPHSNLPIKSSTPHSVSAAVSHNSSHLLVTPLSRSARGRKTASLSVISSQSAKKHVSKNTGSRKTGSFYKSTPKSQKFKTGRIVRTSEGSTSLRNAAGKKSVILSSPQTDKSWHPDRGIENGQISLLSDYSANLLSMQKGSSKRTSHSFQTLGNVINLPVLVTPGKQSISHKQSISKKLSTSPKSGSFQTTSKAGTFSAIETPEGPSTIINVVEETPILHDKSVTARRRSSKVKQLIEKFDNNKSSNQESTFVTFNSSSRRGSYSFSGSKSTPSSRKSALLKTLDEVHSASEEPSNIFEKDSLIRDLSVEHGSRKSQRLDAIPSLSNGTELSAGTPGKKLTSLIDSTPQRNKAVELNSRSGGSEGSASVVHPHSAKQEIKSTVVHPHSAKQEIKSNGTEQTSALKNVAERSKKSVVSSPIIDRPKRKSAGLLLVHIRASQELFDRKPRRNSTPSLIAQTGNVGRKSFLLSKPSKTVTPVAKGKTPVKLKLQRAASEKKTLSGKTAKSPVTKGKTPLKLKLQRTASAKKTLSGKTAKRRLTNMSLLDATANTLKVESPKTPDKKKMAALLQCHKPRMLFSEVLKQNAPPKKQIISKAPSLPVGRRKKMKKTKAHTPRKVLIKGIGSTGHVDSPETIVIHGKQSKALKLQREMENKNSLGIRATTSGWKHVQNTNANKAENVGKSEPGFPQLLRSRKSVSFSPAPQVVAFAASRRINTRKSLKTVLSKDNELNLEAQTSKRASILKKTPSVPVEMMDSESRLSRTRTKKSSDSILSSTPVRGSQVRASPSVQLQTPYSSGKQVASQRRLSRLSSLSVSHPSTEIINDSVTSPISTTFDFDACTTPSISMDKLVSPLSASRKKKQEEISPIPNGSESPSKKIKVSSLSKSAGSREWSSKLNMPCKSASLPLINSSAEKEESRPISTTHSLLEIEEKHSVNGSTPALFDSSPSSSSAPSDKKSVNPTGIKVTRSRISLQNSISLAQDLAPVFLQESENSVQESRILSEFKEIENSKRSSRASRKSSLSETVNRESTDEQSISYSKRKSTESIHKQKLAASEALSSPKKSPKGSQAAECSVKSPNAQSSPGNNLTDGGENRILRSDKKTASPKNDLTDVRGVKRLFKTPKTYSSPTNNLLDITGISALFISPEQSKYVKSIQLHSQQQVQKPLPESVLEETIQSEIREDGSTDRMSRSSRKSHTFISLMASTGDTLRQSRSRRSKASTVNEEGSGSELRSSKGVSSSNTFLKGSKGVKRSLILQAARSSPNDLSDMRGVKTLFRSPRNQIAPKNDLSDVEGVRQLFSLPKTRKSPKNDLSDVTGVGALFSSPVKSVSVLPVQSHTPQTFITLPCESLEEDKIQKEVGKPNRISMSANKSNSLNNEITQRLSRSRISSGDALNLVGSESALETSVTKGSPSVVLKDKKGTKQMLKSQTVHRSPHNDLSDVTGVKELFGSAEKHTSPQNDPTDVKGVGSLLKPPQRRSSGNNLSDLTGVSTLFMSPEQNKSVQLHSQQKVQILSPKSVQQTTTLCEMTEVERNTRISRSRKSNSLSNEMDNRGGKLRQSMSTRSMGSTVSLEYSGRELRPSSKSQHKEMKSTKRALKSRTVYSSPYNDLSDVRGVKALFRSPKKHTSPINDLTDVRGVKKLFSSPERHFSPKNDLSDITGVSRLFSSPEQNKSLQTDSQNNVILVQSTEQFVEANNKFDAEGSKIIGEAETVKSTNNKGVNVSVDIKLPGSSTSVSTRGKSSQTVSSPKMCRSRKQAIRAIIDKPVTAPVEPLSEKHCSSSDMQINKFEVQKDVLQSSSATVSSGVCQSKQSPPRTRRGKKQVAAENETVVSISDKAVNEIKMSSQNLGKGKSETVSDRSTNRTRGGGENKKLNVVGLKETVAENSPRTRSRRKLSPAEDQDELSVLHDSKKLKSAVSLIKSKPKKVAFSDETQVIILENTSHQTGRNKQQHTATETVIEQNNLPVNEEHVSSKAFTQHFETLGNSLRTRRGKKAESAAVNVEKEQKLVTAHQSETDENADILGAKLLIMEETSRTRSRRKAVRKDEDIKKSKPSVADGGMPEKSETRKMDDAGAPNITGIHSMSQINSNNKQKDTAEDLIEESNYQKLGSRKMLKSQKEKIVDSLSDIANSPRTLRGRKKGISDKSEKEKITLLKVTRVGTRRNPVSETQSEECTVVMSHISKKTSMKEQRQILPEQSVNMATKPLSSHNETLHVSEAPEQPKRGRRLRKENKDTGVHESEIEADITGDRAHTNNDASTVLLRSTEKPRTRGLISASVTTLQMQLGEHKISAEDGGKDSLLLEKKGNQSHKKADNEASEELKLSTHNKILPGVPTRGRRMKKVLQPSGLQESAVKTDATSMKNDKTEEVAPAPSVVSVQSPIKSRRRRALIAVSESKEEKMQTLNDNTYEQGQANTDDTNETVLNPVAKRAIRGRKNIVDKDASEPAKQQVGHKVNEIKKGDEPTGIINTRLKRMNANKVKLVMSVEGHGENNADKEIDGKSGSPKTLRGKRLRNRDKITADGLQQTEKKRTDKSVLEIGTTEQEVVNEGNIKQKGQWGVNKTNGDIGKSSDETQLRSTRRKRKAQEEEDEPVKKKNERHQDNSPKQTVSVRATRQRRKC